MDDAERLTELLQRKPEAGFSAYDLASKAYYRSSRGHHHDAALLFEAAGRRAEAEFGDGSEAKRNDAGVPINQALNHWARAGFAWVKAEQMDRALPLLRRAAHADWRAAGLDHDLVTAGAAWTHLVRHAASEGRDAFLSTYAQASEACATLAIGFPLGLPHVMALAELAVALDCPEIAAPLVTQLRATKPMKRELKAFLRDLEARANAGAGAAG